MESTWQFIAFDIEANGFTPDTIFCVGVTDLLSLEKQMFHGDEIADACVLLASAKLVVGHYINGYDCPVIERLTEGMITFTDDQKLDTLDMSRKLTKGPKHSLDMWGGLFGMPKMKQPLFERFTPAMLPYCARDVEITVRLFYHLVMIYIEGDQKAKFRNSKALDAFIAQLEVSV